MKSHMGGMRGYILPFLLIAVVVVGGASWARGEKTHRGVSSRVAVRATAKVCYETIRGLRVDDPSNVRELSRDDNGSVLEEIFDGLPIIGTVKCVYRETYIPYERIEYRMISSDKFKAFEGRWQLSRGEDDDHTIVELSSYTDTGLMIPFVRQITDTQTMKDVQKRLVEVKKLAESRQRAMSRLSGR